MLLNQWPTLEACWGADWCGPVPPPPVSGGGSRPGWSEVVTAPQDRRRVEDDALAILLIEKLRG